MLVEIDLLNSDRVLYRGSTSSRRVIALNLGQRVHDGETVEVNSQ